jgi:hypothetical protein
LCYKYGTALGKLKKNVPGRGIWNKNRLTKLQAATATTVPFIHDAFKVSHANTFVLVMA